MVAPDRTVVGAHYGWGDWLVQRVTAVAMALYTVLILGLLLWFGGLDFPAWNAIFHNEAFRVATFVFMVALSEPVLGNWHEGKIGADS